MSIQFKVMEAAIETTIDSSGNACLQQFNGQSTPGPYTQIFATILVKMAGWYSPYCKLSWRLKKSEFNRWYFKLQVFGCKDPSARNSLLPAVVVSGGKKGGDLVISGLLPTPTAGVNNTSNMSKEAMEKRIRDGRQEDLNMKLYKITGQTGKLNPFLVMEMMGFPCDWTLLPFLRKSFL
jgi:hypothetical protein